MRYVDFLCLLLVLCISSGSWSTSISKREPGAITFELTGEHRQRRALPRHFSRRQQDLETTLENGVYNYYAQVAFGDPEQNVKLWISCVAADTWVCLLRMNRVTTRFWIESIYLSAVSG